MREARSCGGEPRSLWAAGARLGEGPVWDERMGVLWWLDIESRRVHRMDEWGGDRASWDLPARVGCAVLTEDPERLLLGLQTGLFLFSPRDSGLSKLACTWDVETNRPNDGKVDAQGRLWFGVMDLPQRSPTGGLFRMDGDGRVVLQDPAYIVPNGPAFSPDGARFYCANSLAHMIYAFELKAGEPRGKQVFLRLDPAEGVPDGMATDAEGCLWVALNKNGGCVARYDPDGRRIARVMLPVPRVSSLCFGGSDFATLFVTTAGGSGAENAGLDGGVFGFRPGVRGLPTGRFRLPVGGNAGDRGGH